MESFVAAHRFLQMEPSLLAFVLFGFFSILIYTMGSFFFLTALYWWTERKKPVIKEIDAVAILLAMIVFQGFYFSKQYEMAEGMKSFNERVVQFAYASGPGCHYLGTDDWKFDIGIDIAAPFLHLFANNSRNVDRIVYVLKDTSTLRSPNFDPCRFKSNVNIRYGIYGKDEHYAQAGPKRSKTQFKISPEVYR